MRIVSTREPGWWARNQRRLAPYLFISPFYVLFAAFFLLPILFAAYLSCARWNGIDAIRFVGVGNYVELVRDQVFLKTLRNTAFYCGFALLVVIPMSLLLAIVLNARLVHWKRPSAPSTSPRS